MNKQLPEWSKPRYDQNKLRRRKNWFEQRKALQQVGRPSLALLQGKTLLPPGSRRGFMPESELGVIGKDYNQMNAVPGPGQVPGRPEFNQETQPGGYISPPTPPLGPGEGGGGGWGGDTDWDDPNPCDCSCYGPGSTPQGGGCWSGGQPLGPCC